MDKEAQSRLLYEAFVDGYKEYRAYETKVTTVFVVAIGWFLAKPNPFPILEQSWYAFAALAWIIVLFVVFILVPVFHYARSEHRYRELESLGEIPEIVLTGYRITRMQQVATWMIHGAFLVALFCLVYVRYVTT